MVKRSIEQDTRNKNFGAREGNYERNAVVKNPGTKQRGQRILGDCWQWDVNGQCSRGDNCSFRHDINKRGKMTQSNTCPNSFMQQNERKSLRTRSPRGKSPSGRMSRWPCKDYLRGTCTNSFCETWHPPECLFYKTKSGCRFGKSAHTHIVRLMNSPVKGTKRMMTKVQWPCWGRMSWTTEQGNPLFALTYVTSMATDLLCATYQVNDNWVASFRMWSRRGCHQFFERAKTCRNQSNVWNSRKLLVNLISEAPTLQNLRIGLKKRQSGKSKVPAKQRGSWPKVYFKKLKEKHKATFFSPSENTACINS